jgi:hypothetical protein
MSQPTVNTLPVTVVPVISLTLLLCAPMKASQIPIDLHFQLTFRFLSEEIPTLEPVDVNIINVFTIHRPFKL